MGMDIHGIFQKYENNQWIDILSKYDQHRDYLLFEILADPKKRNYFSAISPIKGLPEKLMTICILQLQLIYGEVWKTLIFTKLRII